MNRTWVESIKSKIVGGWSHVAICEVPKCGWETLPNVGDGDALATVMREAEEHDAEHAAKEAEEAAKPQVFTGAFGYYGWRVG